MQSRVLNNIFCDVQHVYNYSYDNLWTVQKNWIHFKGRQGECKWWILENEMQQTKHSELNLITVFKLAWQEAIKT